MKPKALPQKIKIKVAIETFLSMFHPGDQLRSEDIIKYCKKYIGKYIYGDTVLRYAREMREEGTINFTCVCKYQRIFKILKPGEAHSL